MNEVGQTTTERPNVQGKNVRAEFMSILKADFSVTGCENEDDEASDFTGIEIRRNWQRKIITLHQTKFASRLLEKQDLAGARLKSVPYKSKRGGLEPWEGEAVSEAGHFE